MKNIFDFVITDQLVTEFAATSEKFAFLVEELEVSANSVDMNPRINDEFNYIEAAFEDAALIAKIREYAVANYDSGKGWDYLIECWSDADILAEAEGKTLTAALKAIRPILTDVAETEQEIRDAGY